MRKILKRGIEEEKLELGIALYLKGESIGRVVDISDCNLWELLDELKARGITKRFELDDQKEILLATLAKDDPLLQEKIRSLK